MNRAKNLLNLTSGKLTIMERGPNNGRGDAQWWCKCDCGNPGMVLVRTNNLTGARPTQSCGCIQSEAAKKNVIKAHDANRGTGKQWADCHPDRPAYELGLCIGCYSTQRYRRKFITGAVVETDTPRATCCTEKAHYAKGLCAQCYEKKRYHGSEKRKAGLLKTSKAWYQENREHVFFRELKNKFNLTKEEFDTIIAKQGDKCGICPKRPEVGEIGFWHIDHDHDCCPGKKSCGKCVRGILCRTCNAGMGQFYHCTELMESAVTYLKRTKWINAKGETR